MVFFSDRVPLSPLAWFGTLKRAVHPKMKLLSSFTHPQVVSNLYGSLSSVEHKIRYFIKQLMVPIDFHSMNYQTVDGPH